MYRFRIFCTCCLIFVLSSGLTACKPELLTQPDPSFQTTRSWLEQNKATVTYGLPQQELSMQQAFQQGYILIYAEGLPKKEAEHAAQRRLTAVRAAEVVAQRNLAFTLSQGGKYGSVRFDNYSAAITPSLRGYEFVTKEYNNELGKAVVLLRYDLRGAQRFIR